jgi:hypothetical protein
MRGTTDAHEAQEFVVAQKQCAFVQVECRKAPHPTAIRKRIVVERYN